MSRTEPKCWLCGIFQNTSDPIQYQPLICLDCLPEYRERSFVFVRTPQSELDEIFSTKKGFTCQ